MRRLLVIVAILVLLAATAAARSVVMIEKRQSMGRGVPSEQTSTVRLADDQTAQLVTCCGLKQDDTATYTLRDADGYTLVDRKFTSGRFVLAPNGRLLSIQKTGPAVDLTFYDPMLKEIARTNLVGVQGLSAGDHASVAAITRRPQGTVLQFYDGDGNLKWEQPDPPVGAMYFLPDETYLALIAGNRLLLYPTDRPEPRTIEADGDISYVGGDIERKLMILSVNRPDSPEVWALELPTLATKWKHVVSSLPAGHCRTMLVDMSGYVPRHGVVTLLLRCPGERHMFYVARFLNADGEVVGQEKLGRRIDTTFYEINNTINIVSDGYAYTFAIRD